MSLSELERWYAGQCNGEWEHGSGVRIATLDNPGWRVRINLRDTKKEGSALERVRIDRTDNDWIQYWVEKLEFHIACGPTNLSETIGIFVRWFDSN
jgi:immunity protein 53 of polymorphic toxin system